MKKLEYLGKRDESGLLLKHSALGEAHSISENCFLRIKEYDSYKEAEKFLQKSYL